MSATDGFDRCPLIRPLPDAESFEALFRACARRPFTARLSGGWDPEGLGRFSYLGIDPYRVVAVEGDKVVSWRGEARETWDEDPFAVLGRLYEPIRRLAIRSDVPFPFQGGLMGYLGYGLRRWVEKVPAAGVDDLALPDLFMGFYDVVCVWDHFEDRGYVVSSGLPYREGRERARRAQARMEEVDDLLCTSRGAPPADTSLGLAPVDTVCLDSVLSERKSAFDRASYLRAIGRAKAYIAAGDVYQVNLAQRFTVPLACDPSDLFYALRSTNPSPFGAYLRGPDWSIVSVSPERFFRFDGRFVETWPIKGTRPRSSDPKEDRRLRDELLASEKDRAEHVMIVDLERNDLGRFCRYGTVEVSQLMTAQAHPTVWHLVSCVRGVPRDKRGLVAGIRAAFPGGSITGAPKVRAMEIIDELEPVARGVYTGSIGYLGLGGRIDLNIAIRTITVKGGRAHFHVGGGIVADSDPDAEYQETLDKGMGIARALAHASGSNGPKEETP